MHSIKAAGSIVAALTAGFLLTAPAAHAATAPLDHSGPVVALAQAEHGSHAGTAEKHLTGLLNKAGAAVRTNDRDRDRDRDRENRNYTHGETHMVWQHGSWHQGR